MFIFSHSQVQCHALEDVTQVIKKNIAMLEGRFGVLLFLYSVLLTKVLIVIVTLTYSYMYIKKSIQNQYNIMQISDENKIKYQIEDNGFLYNSISLHNS